MGARRREAQIFALFFPSPAPIFALFLSGGLLVEFWWCLKRQDPQKHHQNSNEDPQRERKRAKMEAEEGKKKREIFGRSGQGGVRAGEMEKKNKH